MIYVIAQFLLLAFLAWPIGTLHFSILGSVLIVSGALVAILALLTNRPGNFNVRPIPKKGGELITTGIYHYIRHPMYCSLFFIGLGVLFCQFSLWKLVAWLLLIITLALKARFEERALVLIYSDYKSYQKTTKAFIPLLW
jgi:protein-S-isoprenylcysteine O-methyltransferase Ste14